MTTETGRRRRWKRLLAVTVIVLLIAIYPLRRAVQYAAEPTGPKDCAPLEPEAGSGGSVHAREALATEAALPWSQRGGSVNDASCLNRRPVYGVVQVRRVEDVRRALDFARASGLRVSVAGVKHSMGGHAFAPNAVILDMTTFNQSSLDEERGILTVQSGTSCTRSRTESIPGLP